MLHPVWPTLRRCSLLIGERLPELKPGPTRQPPPGPYHLRLPLRCLPWISPPPPIPRAMGSTKFLGRSRASAARNAEGSGGAPPGRRAPATRAQAAYSGADRSGRGICCERSRHPLGRSGRRPHDSGWDWTIRAQTTGSPVRGGPHGRAAARRHRGATSPRLLSVHTILPRVARGLRRCAQLQPAA